MHRYTCELKPKLVYYYIHGQIHGKQFIYKCLDIAILPCTVSSFLCVNMVKTFTETTPIGKSIKVERFWYPDEDTWMCADCYHVGTDAILATIPCERCGEGKTQISINYDAPKK